MINNVDDEDNPVQQNTHILPRFPLPYVLGVGCISCGILVYQIHPGYEHAE